VFAAGQIPNWSKSVNVRPCGETTSASSASIYVSPANRERLEAIIADRNSKSKAGWRAGLVVATAEGHGTNAIMRLTGKSKPARVALARALRGGGGDGPVLRCFGSECRDTMRPLCYVVIS